jgi:hypothetical protein
LRFIDYIQSHTHIPGRMPLISPSQWPLPTTHTSSAELEPTVQQIKRPQPYALGRGYIVYRPDTTQQTIICLSIHRQTCVTTLVQQGHISIRTTHQFSISITETSSPLPLKNPFTTMIMYTKILYIMLQVVIPSVLFVM